MVQRYGQRGEPVPVIIVRNGARLRRTIEPVPVPVREGGAERLVYRVGLRWNIRRQASAR